MHQAVPSAPNPVEDHCTITGTGSGWQKLEHAMVTTVLGGEDGRRSVSDLHYSNTAVGDRDRGCLQRDLEMENN